MGDWAALRLALDLHHAPWRVRLVREQPLPDGMPLLLNVAAGDAASEEAAVAALGRPLEIVRQAATFLIEQILLAPGVDSYRALGASPAATGSDLRRNMALLMRWLHPDVAREGERAVFAARIAAAWNTLKSPQRRAAYDRERQSAATSANGGTHRQAAWARARSGRAYRSRAAGGRKGGLPRVLAFWLLGRSRY
jgi:hypothetical protein